MSTTDVTEAQPLNPQNTSVQDVEAGVDPVIAIVHTAATASLKIQEGMDKLIDAIDAASPRYLSSRQIVNIYIVYFSVFLDNMGVSIVQPILPFYAESFDATSLQLGMLYSSYSLMATFATIFMAKMSDKFGRRPMIIFSLFGTMTGFLLTGFAWNYESLLAFRFYTGAFGGSFSVAQAYMTDVCPKDQLEKYLAGIGGIMAVAFIIGPLLGGVLAQWGLAVPFFASSAAGLVGFIVACIWLQESYFPEKVKEKQAKQNRLKQLKAAQDHLNSMGVEDHEQVSVEELKAAGAKVEHDRLQLEAEKQKCCGECKYLQVQVWLVLVSYFLASIGWCTFTSMFAQYLIDVYGLNSSQVSIVTVIIGTVYVITNVVIFTYFAKIIGIYWLAAAGLVLFAVSLGLAPVPGNMIAMLIFMCVGVGVGNGVLMPCMSAMGADFSDESNRGAVLGYITVGNQAAYVVGPLIMGALYAVDPEYIFFVGAGFVAAGFIPVLMLLICWPETRKAKTFDIQSIVEIEEYIAHPERWNYKPDKPSKADYKKMGKDFGDMLIERGYQWKTYYPKFVEILDLVFPPVRTDNFGNYLHDCRMVRANLERVHFDHGHIKELQQVSFMGEPKQL
eukprot:357729_1